MAPIVAAQTFESPEQQASQGTVGSEQQTDLLPEWQTRLQSLGHLPGHSAACP